MTRRTERYLPRVVLADRFEGRPFRRPNDLIVARNGGVYFTDPGLTAQQAAELVKRQGGAPLAPRLPPAVYYIPPGGRPIRIEDKMIRPNGIQLGRDDKTLYVSDSIAGAGALYKVAMIAQGFTGRAK